MLHSFLLRIAVLNSLVFSGSVALPVKKLPGVFPFISSKWYPVVSSKCLFTEVIFPSLSQKITLFVVLFANKESFSFSILFSIEKYALPAKAAKTLNTAKCLSVKAFGFSL